MMGTSGASSFCEVVREDSRWGRSIKSAAPPPPDFRAVFEAAPGLFLVLAADAPRYTIAAVSEDYVSETRTKRTALIGRAVLEGLPGRLAAEDASGTRELLTALARVVRTREPTAVAARRYEVRRPAGAGGGVETRWWTVRIAPVLDGSGEVAHVIARIEDVTDVVAQPAPSAARVQAVVEVNRALAAQVEAAEAASAAKTDFLLAMSHELRTPLQAILGFAQLLELDRAPPGDRPAMPADAATSDERDRDRLRRIVHGAEHLQRLVDDATDVSRIEARHTTVSLGPIELSSVVDEVVGTLGALALRSSMSLIAPRLPPDLPRVIADRTRVVQVLINLGTNAIKYGHRGGRVELGVRRVGDALRIAIADDGVGVPAEHRARVFEPYQRAGQERGAVSGSGIGLAIAKRLVELMGGTIGFTSELGRGSEFWITLPIHVPSPWTSAR